MTGREARATGLGRTSSEEIVKRFAPKAHGLPQMEAHHQIEILVATDCLSEGVNLQDCANIVLADLPYSPLAVEQRVGRLVRPGSASDTVTVYLPRPRTWSDSLGLRRRLRGKLDAAARSGSGFAAASQLLIAAPKSPADQSLDDPLAAMTRQDRLAELLDAAGADELPDGDFVADVGRHEPALWVRYASRGGGDMRYGWLRATESAGVVARLGENLPWLIAASERESPIAPGPPDPDLAAGARRFLRERERRLRSARAAPRQIAVGSPQRKLWRYLCGELDAGRISVDDEELATLRESVLRSHARGRLAYIERRVAAGLSGRQALQVARELHRDTRHCRGDPEVVVLGRLYLRGG